MVPRDKPTAIKVQTIGHTREKQLPDPAYFLIMMTNTMIPPVKTKMSMMVKANALYSKS